ncbi:MAG: L-seryl-tRNA(Sec) selenium transferase, partial [Actinomycetota bacterium]
EFRLPDVMEASGAILREVGTTNRTHLRDYKRALSERTALVLKVHPSNYEIVGFTKQPAVGELADAARERDVPLLFDIGSGLLRPRDGALADEPDAASALASGADVVCFSGDKLLGGPQAGVIAGRRDLVERCRRHPIARAVRADKLTLAALEATLWQIARGEPTPTQRMLDADPDELRARAEVVAGKVPGARATDGESVTGGGSLPGRTIPTSLVVLPASSPQARAARLRENDPPVIARIERGSVVLDLRTVEPSDDAAVVSALIASSTRAARAGDARDIAAMQITSMRTAYRGIVPDRLLDSYRLDDFESWRRRAIDERRAAGGETFVAEAGEEIAAFSTGGPCRDEDAPGAGELYGLYAHPDVWGSGFGHALIIANERQLGARGHRVVVVWTFEANGRGRRAYERAGYVADGARRRNDPFGGVMEVRYRKVL